jgi:hypothetical protein
VRSVQSGYGVRWRIEVAEVYGRGKSMWMSTAAGFLAKCCCRWLYSMLLHWVSSMCDVLSWKLGISMNGGMWDAVTRGLRVHVESKLDTMLACFDDSVLISRICVGFGRTQVAEQAVINSDPVSFSMESAWSKAKKTWEFWAPT